MRKQFFSRSHGLIGTAGLDEDHPTQLIPSSVVDLARSVKTGVLK
jgi:hypothetical protein